MRPGVATMEPTTRVYFPRRNEREGRIIKFFPQRRVGGPADSFTCRDGDHADLAIDTVYSVVLIERRSGVFADGSDFAGEEPFQAVGNALIKTGADAKRAEVPFSIAEMKDGVVTCSRIRDADGQCVYMSGKITNVRGEFYTDPIDPAGGGARVDLSMFSASKITPDPIHFVRDEVVSLMFPGILMPACIGFAEVNTSGFLSWDTWNELCNMTIDLVCTEKGKAAIARWAAGEWASGDDIHSTIDAIAFVALTAPAWSCPWRPDPSGDRPHNVGGDSRANSFILEGTDADCEDAAATVIATLTSLRILVNDTSQVPAVEYTTAKKIARRIVALVKSLDIAKVLVNTGTGKLSGHATLVAHTSEPVNGRTLHVLEPTYPWLPAPADQHDENVTTAYAANILVKGPTRPGETARVADPIAHRVEPPQPLDLNIYAVFGVIYPNGGQAVALQNPDDNSMGVTREAFFSRAYNQVKLVPKFDSKVEQADFERRAKLLLSFASTPSMYEHPHAHHGTPPRVHCGTIGIAVVCRGGGCPHPLYSMVGLGG